MKEKNTFHIAPTDKKKKKGADRRAAINQNLISNGDVSADVSVDGDANANAWQPTKIEKAKEKTGWKTTTTTTKGKCN